MGAKESATAKSTGLQEEDELSKPDLVLFEVLTSKKKVSKIQAGYRILESRKKKSCVKCKFNLGDEQRCHVVSGKVNNEHGISNFFSPKGDGMLPGDIVWRYVKSVSRKLAYNEGHVINEGARGFQCRDCKYFLEAGACRLINGRFRPEMSCGFIVKIGNGIDIGNARSKLDQRAA